MHGKTMLMPAVWGGLVIGILSAMPIVSALNICCCLWIVTGGVLAAYVLQANTDAPIDLGDGAMVGFLAGLFGAFVYVVVSLPLTIVLGPLQQRAVSRLLETLRDMPPELRDALTTARGPEMALASVALGLVMMLFLGAIFGPAGGLLGAVFFKKQAAPPAAPAMEPPGYLQS